VRSASGGKRILASEIQSFNKQCDCFVTKRDAISTHAWKEVTNRSWCRWSYWWLWRGCAIPKHSRGQYEGIEE